MGVNQRTRVAYSLQSCSLNICFEVKSEKLSQVAVGLSEPETVTPPAKSNDFLSACADAKNGGRIPDGMRVFKGERVSVLRPNNTATERCIPTGCFARHVASGLRNALHVTQCALPFQGGWVIWGAT